MTQPAATTDRDTRKPDQAPPAPLATCQVCGVAHSPEDFMFCRVCGEPVIIWGWAP
jgi:hypothetical protein